MTGSHWWGARCVEMTLSLDFETHKALSILPNTLSLWGLGRSTGFHQGNVIKGDIPRHACPLAPPGFIQKNQAFLLTDDRCLM